MNQLSNNLKSIINSVLRYSGRSIFIVSLVLLSFYRIFLSTKAPYFGNLYATYDEQLFIRLSNELLKGHWLGEYSTSTLSKGISYSLFLVLGNKLHISYGVMLSFFNIFASTTAVISLRPLVKNKWVLLSIYTFFLYSPVTFTSEYSTKIYRNAIVVPCVLLLISFLIGLYFRRKDGLKTFIPWSLGLSVTFPFYWYIREDSIWLLPLLSVGLFIIAGAVLLDKIQNFRLESLISQNIFSRQKVTKLFLCILPFLMLIISTKILERINETYYGVSEVNDRTQGTFGKVSKQLIRLDDGSDLNKKNSTIWISKSMLKKAESVSQTLNSISKNIDWIYNGSPWSNGRDEIAGDIIFWALRDAASQSGYYKNANETEKFWQKVHSELAEAYKNGDIKKKKEIYLTSTGDGKLVKDLSLVGDFMKTGFDYNVFYTNYAQGYDVMVAPKTEVVSAEKLLNLSFKNVWSETNNNTSKTKELSEIAKTSNIVIKFYQSLVPFILIISISGFIVVLFESMFSKEQSAIFRSILLLIVGLFMTYIVFLIGVSWFCSWGPSAKNTFMMTYTGAGVPVIQWIEILAFVGIFQLPIITKKITKK